MAHALLEKETIVLEDIKDLIEAVKPGTFGDDEESNSQPADDQTADSKGAEAATE